MASRASQGDSPSRKMRQLGRFFLWRPGRARISLDQINSILPIGRKIVRIAVIGGGPGGLYFSYLWKRRHPDAKTWMPGTTPGMTYFVARPISSADFSGRILTEK